MMRLKYNTQRNQDFQKTLKQNIDQYFSDTGQSKKANALMAFKVTFFIIWMITGYLVLFTAQTFLQTLVGYLLSGTGALLTVITVGHDASHKALSRHPKVNQLFSHTWCLLGLSHYLWEAKHHHAHHSFTNVINYDQDISQTALIRMNPADTFRWYHKYQRYYVPFLYLVFGFFAVTYREFKLYFVKLYGNTYSRHGIKLLITIILMKVFYFGLNLALPLMLIPIPAWQVVLAFAIMIAMAGLYIVLVLAVPHINHHATFVEPPQSGKLDSDWYSHALDVTIDSSPSSRVISWFTGGLNTHTIHHLFPTICHIHYRQLTTILEQTAKEFGLNYKKEHFVTLIIDHFKFLADLGARPDSIGQS